MIKKVERTSTTAWSPSEYEEPLLALGTVAGAMNASFSTKTELEIFNVDLQSSTKEMIKIASIAANARFNRIAWGKRYIACGKENGEMDLYNPSELANKKLTLLKRTKNHSGPVRGLHFNPTDHHLLASGSTDGEILIWDMNQLDTPYAPGERSGRLEEVTYLGWNKDVPHILASGSSNGYTVLWDLRNRKEIIKIANPGGRRPITSIQWNPSKATQMVTSSDDDVNPVILVWDLRNASASEKTMSGHQKGILAMDWCPKDSDLLLSSGKDNRTIVWDTESGEPIGDLNHSSNWSFDCRWYPRNPDLCVVASFDGNIMVHSIQGTGHTQDPFTPVPHHEVLENHDPFSSNTVQEHLHEIQQPEFSLIKPPKWLRKHVGASWGFGSSLVMFDQNSSHITIKHIPVNDEIAFRTDQLEFILNENNPETSMEYCDYMAQSEFVDENDKDVWRFMKTLFSSNRKEDLMTFFGDKQDDPRLAKLMNKLTMENSSPAKGSSPGIAHASPQMIEDKGPFQLYSSKVTEDNDVDTLITKSLIVGDFETAVQVCIGSNRMADALAIAFTGGHELMVQTQKEFLKRASKTKSYSRVLQGIVTGELEDLIKSCRLDGKDAWKDILGIICVHANVESLDYYFKILGDKLSQLPGPKNQHFASLCYMGSHNFQSVSKSWFSHSVHDGVENIKVQAMIEKISVFRQAIGFQDPGLSLEFIPGEQFPLNDLYEAYVEYAWIAENHGKVDVAWRFLEQVPVDFIPKHASDNIFVLRDRVYSNKGYPLAVTGGMPSFPYERVDVIDFESKRLAEEQRIQQEQFQHEQERKKSFQQEPFQLQQERKKSLQSQSQNQFQQYPSAHPANQYQQPSVNQYQPVVNQWTPQPPANPWAPPPSNQWAPPRTSAVAPPPVSTGHTSNAPVPHYQPPSHFMPATNQPSQPQFPRRDSYASPNVSHASAPTANYNEAIITRPNEQVCYTKLESHLQKYGSLAKQPQDRRAYEESRTKLLNLHHQMTTDKPLNQTVLQDLVQVNQALDKDDFQSAKKLEHQLRTKHFTETGSWVVGLKKLVEGLEKMNKPQGMLNQPFQPPTFTPTEFQNPSSNGMPTRAGSDSMPPRKGSVVGPPPIGRMQAQGPPPVPSVYTPPPVMMRQPSNPPYQNAPISSQPSIGMQGPPMVNQGPPMNNYTLPSSSFAPPTNQSQIQFGAPPIAQSTPAKSYPPPGNQNQFGTPSSFPPPGQNQGQFANAFPPPGQQGQFGAPPANSHPPLGNQNQFGTPSSFPPPGQNQGQFANAFPPPGQQGQFGAPPVNSHPPRGNQTQFGAPSSFPPPGQNQVQFDNAFPPPGQQGQFGAPPANSYPPPGNRNQFTSPGVQQGYHQPPRSTEQRPPPSSGPY